MKIPHIDMLINHPTKYSNELPPLDFSVEGEAEFLKKRKSDIGPKNIEKLDKIYELKCEINKIRYDIINSSTDEEKEALFNHVIDEKSVFLSLLFINCSMKKDNHCECNDEKCNVIGYEKGKLLDYVKDQVVVTLISNITKKHLIHYVLLKYMNP